MYSVLQIADAILKIAKQNGVSLTPMQLMKLVYIAHGWSLAVRDVDLFEDRIEAWKYGPVIPDLYHATKHFGRNPIPSSLIDDSPSGVDNETNEFLEDVFSKYGHLSAFALSSLTHQSGSPWDMVFREGELGIEIPDTIIEDHYKKMLHDRPKSSAAA